MFGSWYNFAQLVDLKGIFEIPRMYVVCGQLMVTHKPPQEFLVVNKLLLGKLHSFNSHMQSYYQENMRTD